MNSGLRVIRQPRRSIRIRGRGNVVMDIDRIESIIFEFLDKYDLDLEDDAECISEFVYQIDSAQADAIESFVRILEACTP